MVGMDETLVADWFVVSVVVEGMERPNQIRLEEQRDSAWQVIGKNGSHGVQLKE